MFTFLRKIRRRLLDQARPNATSGRALSDTVRRSLLEAGSARKYLLYAIGEIALVVIGILIALQINNWNENKRTKDQVELYLLNLSETIKEDVDKHKRAASSSEFRHNGFQYLLRITGNKPLDVSPLPKDDYPVSYAQRGNFEIWPGAYPDTFNREFIVQCFSRSVFFQTQNINKTVYEEMKSIGLFSKINNQLLKKSIQDYYDYCATFLHENGDWNLRISTSWQSFLRDNYGFVISGSQIFGDPVELLNDPKVIVRIQEMVSPALFRANNSYIAVSLAEKILNEIKMEVNKTQ